MPELNLACYPVTQIDETPNETHVHLLSGDALPAGVGEPSVAAMGRPRVNRMWRVLGGLRSAMLNVQCGSSWYAALTQVMTHDHALSLGLDAWHARRWKTSSPSLGR
jgi:hypothetical protein